MITISDDIGKIVPVICVVRQIVDKQRIKPRPLPGDRGQGFCISDSTDQMGRCELLLAFSSQYSQVMPAALEVKGEPSFFL